MQEVIPVGRKHIYRSADVQDVTAEQLADALPEPQVIVALDVGKTKVLVALANTQGEVARLLRFQMPAQLPSFLTLLEALQAAGRSLALVLEPTGTYGHPLRAQFHARSWPVFLVSPKRTHDAKELYDGVPSKHDAKDACVLARLHAQKLSRRWTPPSVERRELRALVDQQALYAMPLEQHFGRLEALLARHWPELGQVTDVRSRSSVLRWLQQFPDPASVRARPEEAARVLRTNSRGKMAPETIAALVQSAAHSQGEPLSPRERHLWSALLTEVVRLMELCDRCEEEIAALLKEQPQHATLVQMLGATTTAVVVALLGSPTEYRSARTFEKACGLNLKESSSGLQTDRGLHLTKRGPGRVRRYLYLLAMRTIARDPIAKAWYQARSSYSEKNKLEAVVALMRKLTKAAWHVAHGQSYDATRLFDVRRLRLETPSAQTHAPEGGA